jgi:ketosteroid isomerase-like protein
VDKYFVAVHVTVKENEDKKALNTPGGDELQKNRGGSDGGVPFFAFVDRQGGLIVNSMRPKDPDGKHGGNIGHPVEPHEIDYFMAMLAKAAPRMTAEERGTIEKKLRTQKDAIGAELREQVRRAETAFAKTMADRDAKAFASLLADEAVFVSNRGTARGAKAVAQQWAQYFKGAQAPFSWAPERVEVLESGSLAMTSGPVLDSTGKRTGTFNSVWRHEPDGLWKIVLDNGSPACNCDAPGK